MTGLALLGMPRRRRVVCALCGGCETVPSESLVPSAVGWVALSSRRWPVTAVDSSDPMKEIAPLAMPCSSPLLSLRLVVAMPTVGQCIAVTIQREVELLAWILCALAREA